jgi:hypothetical protein
MKLEKILRNWRILILLLLLLASLVSLRPSYVKGAFIERVDEPAALSLEPGCIIVDLNGYAIEKVEDYHRILEKIDPGDRVSVTCVREVFPFIFSPELAYPFLAASKENKTYLGIWVRDPPSNLKLGLDFSEGLRIKTNEPEILKKRLEVYGVEEVRLRNSYLEVLGASEDDLKELGIRGFLEARLMNQTLLDQSRIVDICVVGIYCFARVYPELIMVNQTQQLRWKFAFQVRISEDASRQIATLTQNLSLGECTPEGCFLNESISWHVDGEEKGFTRIPQELKGKPIRDLLISGEELSESVASQKMRFLQAIASTPAREIFLEEIAEAKPEHSFSLVRDVFIAIGIILLLLALSFYKRVGIQGITLLLVIPELIITLGFFAWIRMSVGVSLILGMGLACGISIVIQILLLLGRDYRRYQLFLLVSLILLGFELTRSFGSAFFFYHAMSSFLIKPIKLR